MFTLPNAGKFLFTMRHLFTGGRAKACVLLLALFFAAPHRAKADLKPAPLKNGEEVTLTKQLDRPKLGDLDSKTIPILTIEEAGNQFTLALVKGIWHSEEKGAVPKAVDFKQLTRIIVSNKEPDTKVILLWDGDVSDPVTFPSGSTNIKLTGQVSQLLYNPDALKYEAPHGSTLPPLGVLQPSPPTSSKANPIIVLVVVLVLAGTGVAAYYVITQRSKTRDDRNAPGGQPPPADPLIEINKKIGDLRNDITELKQATEQNVGAPALIQATASALNIPDLTPTLGQIMETLRLRSDSMQATLTAIDSAVRANQGLEPRLRVVEQQSNPGSSLRDITTRLDLLEARSPVDGYQDISQMKSKVSELEKRPVGLPSGLDWFVKLNNEEIKKLYLLIKAGSSTGGNTSDTVTATAIESAKTDAVNTINARLRTVLSEIETKKLDVLKAPQPPLGNTSGKSNANNPAQDAQKWNEISGKVTALAAEVESLTAARQDIPQVPQLNEFDANLRDLAERVQAVEQKQDVPQSAGVPPVSSIPQKTDEERNAERDALERERLTLAAALAEAVEAKDTLVQAIMDTASAKETALTEVADELKRQFETQMQQALDAIEAQRKLTETSAAAAKMAGETAGIQIAAAEERAQTSATEAAIASAQRVKEAEEIARTAAEVQTASTQIIQAKEAAITMAQQAADAQQAVTHQTQALTEMIERVTRLDNVMNALYGAARQIQSGASDAQMPVSPASAASASGVSGAGNPASPASLPPVVRPGRPEFDYLILFARIAQVQWAEAVEAAENRQEGYFTRRRLRDLDLALYGNAAELLGTQPEYQKWISDLAGIVTEGQEQRRAELARAGLKRIGCKAGDVERPFWLEADPQNFEPTADAQRVGTCVGDDAVAVEPGNGGYTLGDKALCPTLARFYRLM